MLRGADAASAGFLLGMRRGEILTHNLVNAETPGYRTEDPLVRGFSAVLFEEIHRIRRPLGEGVLSAYVAGTHTRFTPGPLVETGRPLDFAFVGEAVRPAGALPFFVLVDPAGNFYATRDGRFVPGDDGFLYGPGGFRVADDAGNPIYLGGQPFTVGPDGVLDISGRVVRLGVVTLGGAALVPLADLTRVGDGVFRLPGVAVQGPLLPPEGVAVRNGVYEGSNVDLGRELPALMANLRFAEFSGRSLASAYEALQRLSDAAGRW
ncbi:MAG: hypothetical protein KM296_09130 [Brockia lithotrophica]|nr:hypothetical protein [Brockia lithotrophica]